MNTYREVNVLLSLGVHPVAELADEFALCLVDDDPVSLGFGQAELGDGGRLTNVVLELQEEDFC